MKRSFIGLLLGMCGAVLAGCSGSGPTPISDSGFAEAGDAIGIGERFVLPGVTRIAVTEDAARFVRQDLEVRINDDGDPVVFLDGVRVRLGTQDGAFEGEVDGRRVTYIRIAQTPDAAAELIYIADEDEDQFTAGFFPIGFDTAPDDIGARAGTATYEGDAIIGARQVVDDGFVTGFSNGDVTLNVNFDNGTLDGQARFDRPQDRALVLPTFTLDLEPTSIRGNAFEGTATLVEDVLEKVQSVESATYGGRFYGEGAGNLAGVLSGRITDDDGDILLQGGFVANE